MRPKFRPYPKGPGHIPITPNETKYYGGKRMGNRPPLRIQPKRGDVQGDRPKYRGQWVSMPLRVVPDGTQVRFVEWARQYTEESGLPDLKHLIWLPTQGERRSGKNMPSRIINEGYQNNYPSLFLPLPRCGLHGLFYEMKTPKTNVLDLTQPRQEMALFLIENDYGYVFTDSFTFAKSFTLAYLSGAEDYIRDAMGQKASEIREHNRLGVPERGSDRGARVPAPEIEAGLGQGGEVSGWDSFPVEEGSLPLEGASAPGEGWDNF
jgi:hypothetical protein